MLTVLDGRNGVFQDCVRYVNAAMPAVESMFAAFKINHKCCLSKDNGTSAQIFELLIENQFTQVVITPDSGHQGQEANHGLRGSRTVAGSGFADAPGPKLFFFLQQGYDLQRLRLPSPVAEFAVKSDRSKY
jgi:hypothetical protein